MLGGITVIVPILNEVERLSEFLDNLQSFGAEQIIVVDGGSTDGSLTLLQEYERECLLINSAAARSIQMNAGAAHAQQPILLFLHADTELPNDAHAEILKAQYWGRFDVRFDTASWPMRLVACCMNVRSRLSGIATGDQALFVRRELFESVGGYQEIPLMEDVALCKVLKRKHAPYCSRSRVATSARRWREKGIVKTILSMWWFRFAFFIGVPATSLRRRYDDIR